MHRDIWVLIFAGAEKESLKCLNFRDFCFNLLFAFAVRTEDEP